MRKCERKIKLFKKYIKSNTLQNFSFFSVFFCTIFHQISLSFFIFKYRSTVRIEWYFYYSKRERSQMKKGGGEE